MTCPTCSPVDEPRPKWFRSLFELDGVAEEKPQKKARAVVCCRLFRLAVP
jgi:hypothetical protein